MNKATQRRSFLIHFAYIGFDYYGLEPLRDFPTVGGALYEYLQQAAKEPPKALQFTARTDKHVHAFENFATCWFPLSLDVEDFLHQIHTLKKPKGILYIKATEVSHLVHARTLSKGKHYIYTLQDNYQPHHTPNPFAWQIAPQINLQSLKKACDLLSGTHDFSAFRARGCTQGNPVKSVQIIPKGPLELPDGQRLWALHFEGDGFMRHMVRILTGTLIEVATGLRPIESILDTLHSKSRKQAGLTAPPYGLVLAKIHLCKPILPFLAPTASEAKQTSPQ